jgi:hypothetical protein
MNLSRCALVALLLGTIAPAAIAGERPTFNKETCDPRPDILPYWLTSWHQEYRRTYNRPRYWSGRIAAAIEPTSQEAMTWCEANQAGLYDGPHHGRDNPPVFKRYCYPNPWDILLTGPRPDFSRSQGSMAIDSNTTSEPRSKTAEPSMKYSVPSPSDRSPDVQGTQPNEAPVKTPEDSARKVLKPTPTTKSGIFQASKIKFDSN